MHNIGVPRGIKFKDQMFLIYFLQKTHLANFAKGGGLGRGGGQSRKRNNSFFFVFL